MSEGDDDKVELAEGRQPEAKVLKQGSGTKVISLQPKDARVSVTPLQRMVSVDKVLEMQPRQRHSMAPSVTSPRHSERMLAEIPEADIKERQALEDKVARLREQLEAERKAHQETKTKARKLKQVSAIRKTKLEEAERRISDLQAAEQDGARLKEIQERARKEADEAQQELLQVLREHEKTKKQAIKWKSTAAEHATRAEDAELEAKQARAAREDDMARSERSMQAAQSDARRAEEALLQAQARNEELEDEVELWKAKAGRLKSRMDDAPPPEEKPKRKRREHYFFVYTHGKPMPESMTEEQWAAYSHSLGRGKAGHGKVGTDSSAVSTSTTTGAAPIEAHSVSSSSAIRAVRIGREEFAAAQPEPVLLSAMARNDDDEVVRAVLFPTALVCVKPTKKRSRFTWEARYKLARVSRVARDPYVPAQVNLTWRRKRQDHRVTLLFSTRKIASEWVRTIAQYRQELEQGAATQSQDA